MKSIDYFLNAFATTNILFRNIPVTNKIDQKNLIFPLYKFMKEYYLRNDTNLESKI